MRTQTARRKSQLDVDACFQNSTSITTAVRVVSPDPMNDDTSIGQKTNCNLSFAGQGKTCVLRSSEMRTLLAATQQTSMLVTRTPRPGGTTAPGNCHCRCGRPVSRPGPARRRRRCRYFYRSEAAVVAAATAVVAARQVDHLPECNRRAASVGVYGVMDSIDACAT